MIRAVGQHSAKPAAAKQAQMAEKRGKASNRQGIRYGSRQAGRGSEHFELKDHLPHTHGSRKFSPIRGPRRKTKEQRIVSG
jgi:hypothetical protein